MEGDQAFVEGIAGRRLALIGESYARLTGTPLADGPLWRAPVAVVAHGIEASPLFFYANALALNLFRMPAARFIGMESRLSAGPADRAERAAMFVRLQANDIVTGYGGVRVAGDGSRFRIEDAVIWNLRDDAGELLGQAAVFGVWRAVD